MRYKNNDFRDDGKNGGILFIAGFSEESSDLSQEVISPCEGKTPFVWDT